MIWLKDVVPRHHLPLRTFVARHRSLPSPVYRRILDGFARSKQTASRFRGSVKMTGLALSPLASDEKERLQQFLKRRQLNERMIKLLGVCPSIAFRESDSNNPVAHGIRSPEAARSCDE